MTPQLTINLWGLMFSTATNYSDSHVIQVTGFAASEQLLAEDEQQAVDKHTNDTGQQSK